MKFVFDGCVIDTDAYEVRRDGDRVHVEPQVLDLLILLVENRDRLVSKSEIIAKVWNGRTVSETALTSRIKSARRAIGDDGTAQRFIRTIKGRGFRFVGAIDNDVPHAPAIMPASPVQKPSLAVLPFETMGGDPEQRYFSDGIVEDLITEMSRSQCITIASRSASFVYRDDDVDVREVGSALGVDFVLEGSLRRLGERIRITVQLIEAANGHHLWAERYDRTLTEIFDIQDEIVATIVTTLSGELASAALGQAHQRMPGDWRAYDHYLVARHASQQARTLKNLMTVKAAAERAIAIDPHYAPGIGMLANATRWLATLTCFGDTVAITETFKRAYALAEKAYDIEPTDAQTLRALGWCHILARDYAEAERCLQRAYAINPHDGDVIMGWVTALVYLGRPGEAVALARQTIRRLTTFPDYFLFDLGEALFFAGEPDTAAATFESIPEEQHDENITVVVAAFAHAGRLSSVAPYRDRYVRELETLWTGDPATSLSERINWDFQYRHVYRRMKDVELLRGGLRKAGLPA